MWAPVFLLCNFLFRKSTEVIQFFRHFKEITSLFQEFRVSSNRLTSRCSGRRQRIGRVSHGSERRR